MVYYFDTSALVKIYHNENGSNRAIELFEENADNYISQIAFTEFNCTLYRKFRNKEIAEEKDVLQSINLFEIDMQYENILLIDSKIFWEARNLIVKWGSRFSLKTLDAIHLACFVQLSQYNQITFVSSDKRLCEIVTEMGYDVINPEMYN
jgi:predicted nucleic acid-binding protein